MDIWSQFSLTCTHLTATFIRSGMAFFCNCLFSLGGEVIWESELFCTQIGKGTRIWVVWHTRLLLLSPDYFHQQLNSEEQGGCELEREPLQSANALKPRIIHRSTRVTDTPRWLPRPLDKLYANQGLMDEFLMIQWKLILVKNISTFVYCSLFHFTEFLLKNSRKKLSRLENLNIVKLILRQFFCLLNDEKCTKIECYLSNNFTKTLKIHNLSKVVEKVWVLVSKLGKSVSKMKIDLLFDPLLSADGKESLEDWQHKISPNGLISHLFALPLSLSYVTKW